VKRIVITSSGATVVRNDPEPLLFTEENWNQQAVDEVEREDSNASPMSMYRASKTLAERGVCAV
jgi:nucleoside-diphosphate-sugar epimerase